MYTKLQNIKYVVQRSFLMNDFVESFLQIFGQNKYTNLWRYWTIFCHRTDSSLKKVVKITVLNAIALKLW